MCERTAWDLSCWSSLRWALWIPAVNTHGGFGRWDFVEINDPWNGQNLLGSYLAARREEVGA